MLFFYRKQSCKKHGDNSYHEPFDDFCEAGFLLLLDGELRHGEGLAYSHPRY